MRIFELDRAHAEVVSRYRSHGAHSVELGHGRGEAHAYCIHFDAGGEIGPHPTGFAHLFVVIAGSAWVSGSDDVRVAVPAGHGAFFERGERHAKGSEAGGTALMVQVDALELAAPPPSES